MALAEDAVVSEKKASENEVLVLAFRLDKEEYALDVSQVQEIVRIKNITRVPKAPVYIKGVINLRGDVIPVMDLRRLFNLGETKVESKFRIIVLNIKEKRFGVIVDDVSEVIRFTEEQIEQTPTTVSDSISREYIRGVGKVNNRLIMILDLEKALGFSESEESEAE